LLPPTPLKTAKEEEVSASGQVFWLTDRSTGRAFPEVFSSGLHAVFVPDHSGGSAPELHGIPLNQTAFAYTIKPIAAAVTSAAAFPAPDVPLRS
jgi:hypothetical protein